MNCRLPIILRPKNPDSSDKSFLTFDPDVGVPIRAAGHNPVVNIVRSIFSFLYKLYRSGLHYFDAAQTKIILI